MVRKRKGVNLVQFFRQNVEGWPFRRRQIPTSIHDVGNRGWTVLWRSKTLSGLEMKFQI
jgi:hypothetical protein